MYGTERSQRKATKRPPADLSGGEPRPKAPWRVQLKWYAPHSPVGVHDRASPREGSRKKTSRTTR